MNINKDNRINHELKRHKFILLSGDHYNPLGVVRSLGEKGIRPIVILNSKRPHLINVSKYPQKIHLVNSAEEGVILLLKLYSNEQYKPFVYSCSDDVCCLLDSYYNELVDKFFFFHGKEQGIISYYLDKANINDIAIKYGCIFLKFEILNKGELPKNLKYPVLTKAMNSTLYAWKNEMHICNNSEELLEAYKSIRSDRILVQEYIKKKNELCIDGFSINNGKDVYIPYYTNYLRFSDLSYGAYMSIKPFNQNYIYKAVKKILSEIGYTGIFEVEFLIDNKNKLHFLEVNFRNSTWSYGYTYGGYNMPYLWALGTLIGSIDISNIVPKKKFIALAEEEDYEMMVKSHRVSLWKWLKDFFNADCYYLFNKKDQKPFWNRIVRIWINYPIRKIAHLFGKKWKE